MNHTNPASNALFCRRKVPGCCAGSPSRCPTLAATTQTGAWQNGDAQLLLAEAFITGSGKPDPLPAGQHAADAFAAGLAFVEALASSPQLISAVCCSPREPFNLLAAMALVGRVGF
jgi:hypothetical protein